MQNTKSRAIYGCIVFAFTLLAFVFFANYAFNPTAGALFASGDAGAYEY
jgi:hypothetical protein